MIFYQIGYEKKYLEPQKSVLYSPFQLPHDEVYRQLKYSGYDIECVTTDYIDKRHRYCSLRNEFIDDGWYNPFCEIVYCYGMGGRFMIIREVSKAEQVKLIKSSVFADYKDGETWIEERNYRMIKERGLNIKDIHAKINKAVSIITKQPSWREI